MKVNEKAILPLNGVKVEFHENIESFSLSSPNKIIKNQCELLTNLENYPLLYAEIVNDIESINKNLGTKTYLNNVLNAVLAKSQYTVDNELDSEVKYDNASPSNKMKLNIKRL